MAHDKDQSIREQIKKLKEQRDIVSRQPSATREERILRAETMSMIDQTIHDLELILRTTRP